MKKKAAIILIALILSAFCFSCNRADSFSHTENAVWNFREGIYRDGADGFDDAGAVRYEKAEVLSGNESDYPAIGKKTVSDRGEKTALDRELDSLYLGLENDVSDQTVKRHPAALAQFSIDKTKFDKAPRIRRKICFSQNKGLRFTGLFLPAGETVTVKIPQEFVGEGIKIVLNSLYADLSPSCDYYRIPKLYYEFALNAAEVKIAHPFGGFMDVYLPVEMPGINVEISGGVAAGYYRLGVDSSEGYASLWDSGIGTIALDFGAGTAFLPIADLPKQVPVGALNWWNTCIKKISLLSREKSVLRLIFEGDKFFTDAYKAEVTVPRTLSQIFCDYDALLRGAAYGISESAAAMFTYDFALSGNQSAVDFVSAFIKCSLTSLPPKDSLRQDAAIAAALMSDKTDFSDMSVDEKTGFYMGLYYRYGEDALTDALKKAGRGDDRDRFFISLSETLGSDLSAYARLYKMNLSVQTDEILKTCGNVFYAAGTKYTLGYGAGLIGAGLTVEGNKVTLDSGELEISAPDGFEFASLSGDTVLSLGDGKYELSLNSGKCYFSITLKHAQTGETVSLPGAFTDGLGKRDVAFSPLDSGSVTQNGLYKVSVFSADLRHSGKWKEIFGGVYECGRALKGYKGAKIELTFYGKSLEIFGGGAGSLSVTESGQEVEKVQFKSGEKASHFIDLEAEGEHTLTLKVTALAPVLSALAVDNVLYKTISSDSDDFSLTVGKAYGLGSIYLKNAATIVIALLAAGLLILFLFAVVFPVVNAKTGAQLPCIQRRKGGGGGNGGEANKFLQRKSDGGKSDAKGARKASNAHGYMMDWDDSWVKEVALPPVTKTIRPEEKVISPMLVANAPLLSEVEEAQKLIMGRSVERTKLKTDISPLKAAVKEREAMRLRLQNLKEQAAARKEQEKLKPLKPILRAQIKPLGAAAPNPKAPCAGADDGTEFNHAETVFELPSDRPEGLKTESAAEILKPATAANQFDLRTETEHSSKEKVLFVLPPSGAADAATTSPIRSQNTATAQKPPLVLKRAELVRKSQTAVGAKNETILQSRTPPVSGESVVQSRTQFSEKIGTAPVQAPPPVKEESKAEKSDENVPLAKPRIGIVKPQIKRTVMDAKAKNEVSEDEK